MSGQNTDSTNAAASTAGQELLTATLQRNPLVAFGAALLGPIIGLFKPRGRTMPTHIEKLKVESFRSSPLSPAQTPVLERSSNRPRIYTEPTARKRPPGPIRIAATAGSQKGGYSHG